MSGRTHIEQRRPPAVPQRWQSPQRRCACGGIVGPDGECASCRARRLAAERQPNSQPLPAPSSIVQDVLGSPGQPLDSETRAAIEPKFGHSFGNLRVHPASDQVQTSLTLDGPRTPHEQQAQQVAERMIQPGPAVTAARPARYDFSEVRVHADDRAAQAARSLHADAFTYGRHIVFGASQYAPRTTRGQRLLAHELTHVVQQQRGVSRTIQRSISVVRPRATAVNQPAGGTLTNAQTVQGWIDTLCPKGGWVVDPARGTLDSADRATFCGSAPTPGKDHFTQDKPAGCGCLCDLTSPGSRIVRVHVENMFWLSGSPVNVNARGEGVTIPPDATRAAFHVGISGLEPQNAVGAGDTAPLSGHNPTQSLRSPAWLNFAHEVCGHARLHTSPSDEEHVQTPEGNLTAVDVANQVRREQSTIANNFGLRRGDFQDATGTRHDGSVYVVSAGETLSSIAVRCGIPHTSILARIFRSSGAAITPATQGTLAVNERLMIEGIFWHEVIAGETLTSIGQMWQIPIASLLRANPDLTDPRQLRVGQRLLIPAT